MLGICGPHGVRPVPRWMVGLRAGQHTDVWLDSRLGIRPVANRKLVAVRLLGGTADSRAARGGAACRRDCEHLHSGCTWRGGCRRAAARRGCGYGGRVGGESVQVSGRAYRRTGLKACHGRRALAGCAAGAVFCRTLTAPLGRRSELSYGPAQPHQGSSYGHDALDDLPAV